MKWFCVLVAGGGGIWQGEEGRADLEDPAGPVGPAGRRRTGVPLQGKGGRVGQGGLGGRLRTEDLLQVRCFVCEWGGEGVWSCSCDCASCCWENVSSYIECVLLHRMRSLT